MKMKKMSVLLMLVAILAIGTVSIYASEDFSIVKHGSIPTYSNDYEKTNTCLTAMIRIISNSDNNSGYKTVFRVYDRFADTPATASLYINNNDHNKHTMAYYRAGNSDNKRNCDYKTTAFTAYMKAHDSGYKAPDYSYVIARWNPNT